MGKEVDIDSPCRSCCFEKSCRYSADDYEVEDCKDWSGKEGDD